jgi:hypothetical protein
MGEMVKMLKIVMMQLIKTVQVSDMNNHQVMMMMILKVTIIHLIYHRCSSREEVGEIQYLPTNILHINMC